jgi:hypothetical protein
MMPSRCRADTLNDARGELGGGAAGLLPPADSESYQARAERREQHAKINYAPAGWWPTTLLCNLGVMLGVAHLRIVQAEKAEHQRENAYATHKPTMALFHFDWFDLMRCFT